MSGKWWDEYPKAALSPIDAALAAEGVTGTLADVARSIYAQESGSGKNTTTSNAGAVGGMQILPGTFREVAEKGWDINDPVGAAKACVALLSDWFPATSGEIVHVDGGFHAMGV